MRTSATHPLKISEVDVGPGKIGMTFLPGKKGPSVHGDAWDRDLAADVGAIKDWGAEAVLTLVEDHELDQLRVPRLGEVIEAAGMTWYHKFLVSPQHFQ